MKSDLKLIGFKLAALRKARNEDIKSVANAVDVAPGVLQNIESGNLDFQLKILFDLCDYYEAEVKSVVGQGELLATA